MTMTAAEREKLVELWGKVPECRINVTANVGASTIPLMYNERTGKWTAELAYMPCDFDDRIIAALARDAILEWMVKVERCTELSIQLGNPHCWVQNVGLFSGPTRLSALISAANAVGAST